MADLTHADDAGVRPERIIFIDDEKNVLLALQRQLRKDFAIETATGYDEALKLVESGGPVAVAVCDMRMPGRDGVETLAAIEKASPETVRIMLTGNADQGTAAAAINQGHIFRFLTKPCSDEMLRAALNNAIRQHQLITAEKTLLQQTLTGSVRLLVDVLSMIAPEEFGRATRARQWVMPLAKELGLSSRWDIELATMLSPIGYVAIPPEISLKVARKMALSPTEKEMLARVPETGRQLLAHIPRLKNVALWVSLQNKAVSDDIPMGARIVKILTDLAEVTEGDVPSAATLARLQPRKAEYDTACIAALGWGHPIR